MSAFCVLDGLKPIFIDVVLVVKVYVNLCHSEVAVKVDESPRLVYILKSSKLLPLLLAYTDIVYSVELETLILLKYK